MDALESLLSIITQKYEKFNEIFTTSPWQNVMNTSNANSDLTMGVWFPDDGIPM